MRQTLFLMLGYPGAGKTTTAKIIHEQTGAVHLWADHERRKRFGAPTHSHAENLRLYAELNKVADDLLAEGKSVIFDTNFNFFKDREHLRQIAAKHGAQAVVVWLRTPIELARERATKDAHKQHTRVLGDMPLEHFERIVGNLQPPREGERFIEFDGTNLDPQAVVQALQNL